MKNKAYKIKGDNKDELYKRFLIAAFLEKVEKEEREKKEQVVIFKRKVKEAVEAYSKANNN